MTVQVVREASVRALGLRPFDVQVMGGVVLHEGVLSDQSEQPDNSSSTTAT